MNLSMISFRRVRGGRLLRALWAAGVGGLGTMYLVSLSLHSTLLLPLYCESECVQMVWEGCVAPESQVMLRHIRRQVLDPPQKQVAEPITPQEVDDPPWFNVRTWMVAEGAIRQVFAHKVGDGEERSVRGGGSRFWCLHVSHSWLEYDRPTLPPPPEGLSDRVCVSDYSHNKQDVLWSPGKTEDLSDHYRNMALSRSTLMAYVTQEDQQGSLATPVQCYTLEALVWAAFGHQRPIDLLVLDTAGGEYKILDTLQRLKISCLLVKYNTEVDRTFIMASARLLNLYPQHSATLQAERFLFFVNPSAGYNITSWERPT
nr:uncharacterized protein LOC128705234 [Cherax quadricarinatus]